MGEIYRCLYYCAPNITASSNKTANSCEVALILCCRQGDCSCSKKPHAQRLASTRSPHLESLPAGPTASCRKREARIPTAPHLFSNTSEL